MRSESSSASVRCQPVADETFDVVISNGVIDLIPDWDAVFSGIYRVLIEAVKPGGCADRQASCQCLGQQC